MDGGHRSGREDRPLHTLLAAQLHKLAQIAEVAEFGLVHAGLGPGIEGPAHLGDHHPDLPGRDLHHRVLAHAVQNPKLEPPAGKKQVRLIARLAVESNHLAFFEFLDAEPLDDQPHLVRADDADGRHHQHQHHHNHHADHPGLIIGRL